MTTTIETKYGTANIGPDGYYRITSYKEGNHSKKLHRLIFEDFYQIKLPSNMVIHHEDENKLNNEMWNLVPMTHEEHVIIHHKGKPLSDEHKEKISQANKGKLISEESRKRMSEAHIGISPSVETRKKLSEAITGEKNYWYGKHHSDETKEKIRQSKLGTKHSEETKRKMSENHYDISGVNNPNYHKYGEKHHGWKDYARIIKKGKKRGKQLYGIMFKGELIKCSLYTYKLETWFNRTYPNERLVNNFGSD